MLVLKLAIDDIEADDDDELTISMISALLRLSASDESTLLLLLLIVAAVTVEGAVAVATEVDGEVPVAAPDAELLLSLLLPVIPSRVSSTVRMPQR